MTIDSMQVGEVRVAKAEDFEKFRRLVDQSEGWTLQYDKHGTKVCTRITEGSNIKVIKVIATFSDVACSCIYDVLHDAEYRKCWDEVMVECSDICRLDDNNDIGYYSIKCPAPLKNRDFVTQRSWCCNENEFAIFNHSVHHKEVPAKKGFIRGLSILTGYLGKKYNDGCVLTYVTQVDMKGKLPKWLVNKVSTKVTPKVVSKLHRAALSYNEWKEKNEPVFKPWLWPEQNKLPKMILDDVESVESDSQSSDQDSETEQDGVIEDGPDNFSSEDNLDGDVL